MRREIYVSAAALGAAADVTLLVPGVDRIIAGAIGMAAEFGLRALAIGRGLALPPYGEP